MSPKKNVIKDDETKTVMRRRSTKGRADEDAVDDTQTRKMQSNMKTQLNNAQKRLDAHQSGEYVLPQAQVEELQNKTDFLKAYNSLSRKSEMKAKLLQEWSQDKSCKQWALSRTRSHTSSIKSTSSAQMGYGTKLLGCTLVPP